MSADNASASTSSLDHKYFAPTVKLFRPDSPQYKTPSDRCSYFASWADLMTDYLTNLGFWDSEKNLPPTDKIPAMKARLIILNAIDHDYSRTLTPLKTAVEVWQALRTAFRGHSITDRYRCIGQLSAFSFSDYSDIPTALTALASLEHDFLTSLMGGGRETFVEDFTTYILLKAIPDDYESCRVVFEREFAEDEAKASNPSQVSQRIRDTLLQEHNARRDSSSALGTANKAVGPKSVRSKQSSSSASSKTQTPCQICVQLGATSPFHEFGSQQCQRVIRAIHHQQKQSELGHAKSALANRDAAQYGYAILDSGASHCLTGSPSNLANVCPSSLRLSLADGSTLPCKQQGSLVTIPAIADLNAHFAPGLSEDLLSISRLTDAGYNVHFYNQHADIVDSSTNALVVQAPRNGSLYVLPYGPDGQALACRSLSDWHQRLNHLNVASIRKLASENLVEDMTISDTTPFVCMTCIQAKSISVPHVASHCIRATRIGERIHVDICSIGDESIDRNTYMLTATDDFSRYTWVFPMKSRAQAPAILTDLFRSIHTHTNRHVEFLRSDNEFWTNGAINSLCRSCGTHQEVTNSYTPQQDGVSERKNRTLLNGIRAALLDSNLPHALWAEAAQYVAYCRNRSPTKLCSKTPYEAWFSRKPSLDNLYAFGSAAYFLVPAPKRTSKLNPRATSGIFVGYALNKKAYRILLPGWPNSYKIVETENVTILPLSHTSHAPLSPSSSPSPPTQVFDLPFQVSLTTSPSSPSESAAPVSSDSDDTQSYTTAEESPVEVTSSAIETLEPIADPAPRHAEISSQISTSNILPHRSRSGMTTGHALRAVSEDMPTLSEAQKRSDWNQFEEAIADEFRALEDRGVLSLVPRIPHMRTVGSKLVLKIKRNADRSVSKYKARLVAQGFSQVEGLDYEEIFAPVAKLSSLRACLHKAARMNWEIDQVDVVTAFLLGDIDKDIYMEQPRGYIIPGKENYVYKLRKSLYGLKQSPRLWNLKLDKYLRSAGWKASKSDPCVYRLMSNNSVLAVLFLYVDDMLFMGPRDVIDRQKRLLSAEFPTTDLGEAKYILGYEIERDRAQRTINLHQHGFIISLLQKFQMLDCVPAATPSQASVVLTVNDQPPQPQKFPYRQLVGALLYLANGTRPDISSIVSKLCRFNNNPSATHWTAAKYVLRYLKGTRCRGLLLGLQDDILTAYADADWAGDLDTRKSTTGYVIFLGSSPISWKSKLQEITATCSMESELISACRCTQDIIYLRALLHDLDMPQPAQTTLYEDNLSAIKYMKGQRIRDTSKAIGVRLGGLRDVLDNTVSLVHVPTKSQLADGFTKLLSRPLFQPHFDGILRGLVCRSTQ